MCVCVCAVHLMRELALGVGYKAKVVGGSNVALAQKEVTRTLFKQILSHTQSCTFAHLQTSRYKVLSKLQRKDEN